MMNQNIINFREKSILKNFNWNYVSIILALQIIGLINLYSAAYSTEYLSRVFYAQIHWILIGWLAFYFIYRLRYQVFLKYSVIFYGLNLIALILVLFIGQRIYGSRRWLDLVFSIINPQKQ